MDAVRNLTKKADLPVEQFPWGTLQWLASGRLMPGAEQTIGVCQIEPGQRNPLHFHPNCEEMLYMLEGTGRHRLDDASIELGPGMTLRIPANVRHNLENIGPGPIRCLIAFSSGDRQSVFLE